MLTHKDFYTAVMNGNITDEVKATAKHYLDKTTKEATAKANASAIKRAKEAEPKIALIEAYFCSTKNEPVLLSTIAEATGLSIQTISGLATQAEKRGHWAKFDAKIKGKGTMRAIALTKSRYEALCPPDEVDEPTANADVITD